ncbi:MAG: hypothetical protein AAF462_10675 [Thermodesulfobacteriota bacterium]
MKLLSNQECVLAFKYIPIVLFSIFLLFIYGCPNASEVPPASEGACFEAAMKFTVPDDCDAANCCDTENFLSFTFTRTDAPSSNPITINAPAVGIVPIEENGALTCTKTVRLPTSDFMDVGFGRWQVTHRYVPNFEITCDEVEITQCPSSDTLVGTMVSHTRNGVNECVQELHGFDQAPPGFPDP